MLKYLLDTNIVIYVIKNRPLSVLKTFNQNHGRMAISTITLAELAHGVEKSADQARNLTANDLHIAGHARSLGLVIVTNNLREFERIPGVSVENWVGVGE